MSAILPSAPQGRSVGVWRHALSLAGPCASWGECSERRCMPSLRHDRPGARAAERSGALAPSRSGGTGACAAARTLARSRGPARWDGGKRRRSGYAAGISRHFVWPSPHLAYRPGAGAGTVHGLPNSVPVFSDRCNCKGKSIMTAYIVLLFRVIPRPGSRGPSLTLSDDLLWTLRPSSRAPAAVRRRPGPDRYRLAHISLYELELVPAHSPSRDVAVPMPVLLVPVPRVLPGFSGYSQVHLSRM